jgi:hypothetical protein
MRLTASSSARLTVVGGVWDIVLLVRVATDEIT